MVKNLIAIKTYPLGIYRNCMYNECSYQEHPSLLKELNILLNFNWLSCCEYKSIFHLGVSKHPKQRELFSYPPRSQKKSSLLSPPPKTCKMPQLLEQNCVFTFKSKDKTSFVGRSDFRTNVAFGAINLQDSLVRSLSHHSAVQNLTAKILREQITLWVVSYILRTKCFRKGR